MSRLDEPPDDRDDSDPSWASEATVPDERPPSSPREPRYETAGGTRPPSEDSEPTVSVDGPPAPSVPGALRAAAPRLDRFEIEERLGAGGMGEVVAVRDTDLGRSVAAKLIRGRPDQRQVNRFLREARITGQLEHPGIVPVYELGRAGDGQPYFLMRRVRGQDLGKVLTAQRTEAGDEAPRRFLHANLMTFLRICEPMAFAHARGVIHRDLKPDNIMLGAYGEVLVMDWGLARVLDSPKDDTPGEAVEAGTGDETQAGSIMGTPAYMAPEQARGEIDAMDARSDVYALGGLLYTLLTGAKPYEGDTAYAILAQVGIGELVPPSKRVRHHIPWELEAAVLQAMQPAPTDRYADALELADDVRAYLEHRELAAADYRLHQRAIRWARRHRVATAVLLALALATATLAGVAHWRTLQQATADLATARVRHEVPDALSAWIAAWEAHQQAREPGDPDPVESNDLRDLRQKATADQLESIRLLDRVLAVRPGDAGVLALRQAAGRRLIRLALIGRDYTIAGWSLEGLARHGASVDALRARIDALRQREVAERSQRVARLLDDVRAGLARKGRSSKAPTLAECIRELGGYKDARTVGQLGAALKPLIARAKTDRPLWTRTDRDLASLVCRALATIGLPASVPPLADWLAVVRDGDMAREAGLALCDTRQPDAYEPLVAALDRLPTNDRTRLAILGRIDRIPEPAGTLASDLTALGRRGMMRRMRGDLKGALADLTAVLSRRPKSVQALLHRALAHRDAGDLAKAEADLDRLLELRPLMDAHVHRSIVRQRRQNMGGALADIDAAIRLKPREPAPHALRADLLLQKGLYAEALAAIDRALARAPQHASWHSTHGQILTKLRRYDEALASFDRAVAYDDRSASHLISRADCRIQAGDLPGARADLERAASLGPGDLSYFRALARLSQATGDLDRAMAAFDEIVERTPGNAVGYLSRALLHLNRRRYAQGAKDLDRAFAHATEPHLKAKVLVHRATLHVLRGRRSAGMADAELAIRLDPRQGYMVRAELRKKANDLKGALADYDRAVELAPDDARIRHNRAVVRDALGDRPGAEADYTAAIDRGGLAESYLMRGQLRSRGGDPTDALRDFDQALRLDPKLAMAHGLRGNLLCTLKKYAEAKVDLNRAIALDPRSAGLYATRALILRRMKDLPGSLRDLNTALKLQPRLRRAYLDRAYTHREMGQLAEAEADFDRALRSQRRDPIALWGRGKTRVLRKNPAGAEADFRAALTRAPDHVGIVLDLSRLLAAQGKRADARTLLQAARARVRERRARRTLDSALRALDGK